MSISGAWVGRNGRPGDFARWPTSIANETGTAESQIVTQKTVLVTGANGYVGNAVAKAFARAGWRTYGLVRREEAVGDLARNEIQPLVGPGDGAIFDISAM